MTTKRSQQALLLASTHLVMLLGLSTPTHATLLPSTSALELIQASCPANTTDDSKLTQLKSAIASATTIQAARDLALVPTDRALQALEKARALIPFSEDLDSAATRLNDTRNRILLASSQTQIADEFDGMLLAGLDNDRAAHLKVGKASCNYSSGETIAIVIGLILGIIPGLILMVLLC